MPVTFEELRQKLMTLPGVEESPFAGTPGFKVRRRTLARLRSEVDPDSFMLAKVEDMERQMLIAQSPEVYYYTQHYASGPYILIHLSQADPDELWELIEQSWRRLASKRQLAVHEASA
ncbi:MAG: MmcQ/YjbR family DNA-binding protein [Dehalococcoidia bacterium]|nr:MmcQ/YjbR family DNA-binding protein [Dehalococcoidia bacterium]